MNWQDEGYLLSKRKFRENANIINIFTKEYGKVSGIVYGGNSRKIKNFLQISNKIFTFYTSKNENRIGYFKSELIKAICPKYFGDRKRTSALLSLSSLLNILLPESQPNKIIYNSLEKLLSCFDDDNWFFLYIFWELNLIKELGFDPNLNKDDKDDKDNQLVLNLDIDGSKYQVPKFLITKKLPTVTDNYLINKSLIFTRSIMMNKFFTTNNLIFPKSRIILENYFN